MPKSRHSRESGNPEIIENTAFRIALRLCGMTKSELRHSLLKKEGRGGLQAPVYSIDNPERNPALLLAMTI